jgi:hypothetical protein
LSRMRRAILRTTLAGYLPPSALAAKFNWTHGSHFSGQSSTQSFIAAVVKGLFLNTTMGIICLSAYVLPVMSLEQAKRIPGYNSRVLGLYVAGSWRGRNQKR